MTAPLETAHVQEFDTYRACVAAIIDEHIPPVLRRQASQGSCAALREIYLTLGAHSLLAPAWPAAIGGQGLPAWSAIAAYEALVDAGIPDTPHILGIQIVGRLLRYDGSDGKWEATLRSLARGETFACVLYTEPTAGSDLASITTTAVRHGQQLRITGRKILSLYATQADIGIALVREGDTSPKNRYAGLSMFVVDMSSPAVASREMRSLQDEKFCEVTFRECPVEEANRVGRLGNAWSTLDAGLAAERTGLDHVARARRWLAHARPDSDPDGTWRALHARVDAISAWSRQASIRAENGPIRTGEVADLKVAASEVARDVAWTAAARVDLAAADPVTRSVLDGALRESPGLCLSAGTSEMMFATMLSALEEGWEQELDPARLALEAEYYAAIVEAVGIGDYPRSHPETRDDTDRARGMAERLASTGMDALEAPAVDGGMGLPLSFGVTVSQALGAAYLEDPYAPTCPRQTQTVRACARILSANAAAFKDAWRYMSRRTQFGHPLTSYSALVQPLLHDLVNLRVATHVLARTVNDLSETDEETLMRLCIDVALPSTARLMHACGTQTMTERSTLGTAYSYVVRQVQNHHNRTHTQAHLPDLTHRSGS